MYTEKMNETLTPSPRHLADRALLVDHRVPAEHRLAVLAEGKVPGDPTELLKELLAREQDGEWAVFLRREVGFYRTTKRGVQTPHASAVAQRLVNLGADPFSFKPCGLDEAMRLGWSEWAAELLAHPGCPPTTVLVERTAHMDGKLRTKRHQDIKRGPTVSTWLHAAVERGQPLLVSALTRAGWDPNQYDPYGVPPLFDARDPEVVDALLDAGADVGARDKNGQGVGLLTRWRAEGLTGVIDALPQQLDARVRPPEQLELHVQGLFKAADESKGDDWDLYRMSLGTHLGRAKRALDPSTSPTTPLYAVIKKEIGRRGKSNASFPWSLWDSIVRYAPTDWLTHQSAPPICDGALAWLILHDRRGRTPSKQAETTLSAFLTRWDAAVGVEAGFALAVEATLSLQGSERVDAAMGRAWKGYWDRTASQMTSHSPGNVFDGIVAVEEPLSRLLQEGCRAVTRPFLLRDSLQHNPGYWVERGAGALGLRLMGRMNDGATSLEWLDELLDAGASWDPYHPLAESARNAWGNRSKRLNVLWAHQDEAKALDGALPHAERKPLLRRM